MDRGSEDTTNRGAEVTVCFDSIIEYAAERLAYSVRKSTLKLEVSLILYGEDPKNPGKPVQQIAPRTYETLAGKARALLKERSQIGSQQAREESIGFYENLLRDPEVSASAKIKARENLDRIQVVSSLLPMGSVPDSAIDLNKLDLDTKKKILDSMRGSDAGENPSK